MAAQYGNLGDTKGVSKVTLNTSEKNPQDDDGYKGLLEALWGKKPENDGEKTNDTTLTKSDPEPEPVLRKSTISAARIDYTELKSPTLLTTGLFTKIYKATWRDQSVVFKHFYQQKLSSKYEQLAKKITPSLIKPHANVLKIYGICLDIQLPIGIVSDWTELGDLKTLLQSTKEELSYVLLLQLCTDVAKGLKHVHSEGFNLKNLSARKVLVTERKGRWFCVLNHTSIWQIFKKTEKDPHDPFWQAPEVMIDPATAYEKSDVWLLACTMLEIINQGADPFMGPDEEEIKKEVFSNSMHAIIPETAPARLVELIHACLATDPKDRPSVGTVLKELAEVEEELSSNPFFS